MNLRDTILAEHSRAQTDKIVKWVGNRQDRFDELFKLFSSDEYRVVQRAAWPLIYAAIAHPRLIQKHLTSLIRNLRKPGLHEAVKRNSVRILQQITVPAKLRGELMNTCFDYITDPVEKPAIKAFSLTVLHNLSIQCPDIKQELKLVIETQWQHESAAFRSRAKKIMNEL